MTRKSKTTQEPAETMSQAEYARHRDVKRQYIGRLVKSGVLIMREGRIAVLASDAVLDDRAKVAPPDRAIGSDDASEVTYASARLQREIYSAKLRRLEFEAKDGTLIPAAEVKQRWLSIADLIVKKLDAVPSKLAPQMAALSDVKQIRAALAEAMREVQRGIAGGIRDGGI